MTPSDDSTETQPAITRADCIVCRSDRPDGSRPTVPTRSILVRDGGDMERVTICERHFDWDGLHGIIDEELGPSTDRKVFV